ncbi:protein kinase domain-containing protein [Plantactinospora endophytica]|uniref:non-specific serine/threonine protein kinase n=1 Tax=Plantactinospora endophytica TaxID=673535 RepID=A0ABQ4E4Z9_9ACTN|nr:protein kinase [Plantactinospora endophytica]GIG89784.1 serine/threonine protein kinase [Plantactinospora endophytica]
MTGWGRWVGAERHGTELVGDRYRLVEELGEGGMSVVWRGHDEVLGRPVAVKMLAPRLSADRSFRDRLRTEARAAARLCHPHITGVYDYGESIRYGRTVPYVVMELIDGESLASWLDREGPLPWWDGVVLGAQVASALASAHARGVVHRDITPGNVMLAAMGAKVVDFGISALVGERDGDGEGGLYGTPAYVAPERLNQGEVCPATDVYALGLLLYRTLTGRMPWQASTRTQVLRAHLYAEPAPLPPVPGLPDEVASTVLRCLAKAPEERPGSGELARTLARAAGVVLPVAAGQPGPADTAEPAPVRSRPATSANSETAILPGPATGPLPLPGRRRWSPAVLGNRVRVAAVGVGLLAVSGAVWAGTGDGSVTPAGANAATNLAMGGSASCRVDYVLRADTGRSFQADVTVTNLGAAAVRDWTLRFTFPGEQMLTRDPSPESRQQGRDVLLRPAGSETALPAGGAVRFGLVGSHAGSNPLPVEFRLGETACAARVSGVPGETGETGETGGAAAGAEVGMTTPQTPATQSQSQSDRLARPAGNTGPGAESGPKDKGPGPGPGKPKAPKPKHGHG